MKILLSWLKDYVNIDESPEKIAEGLIMTGLEVESIHQPAKSVSKVVVGKIESIDRHPNADKLVVCKVSIGDPEPLTIVCGAMNMVVGDKVPVAVVGATLPSGFDISRAKIRGVESFGMMCSKSELGVSDEHDGLWILPKDSPPGEDLVKLMKMDDAILDVSITPNRGDALSHLGIAREVSAIFNHPLDREALEKPEETGDVRSATSVEIKAPVLCPRYAARVVRGVKVGSSPAWLQERLEKIGIRPINNVVDITNYVMMDIGHPMHAFDYDKLAENRIVVRRADRDEVFKALDGVERKLNNTMLVIADAVKPVALAGVMGGLETSVTTETRNILLEAACFEPVSVRKTAKTLAMASDSSYRFERGVNIENVPISLNKAAAMIAEIAGGEVLGGIVDQYPSPQPLRRILLRTRRVCKILGVELSPAQIETFLLRLKLEVKRDGETLWIGVPPYRHDLEAEHDLIEEVARIYGYNRIPQTLPAITSTPVLPTALQKLENRSRDHLVSLGFNEMISFSFIPSSIDEAMHERKPIKIVNPLSEEQGVMRTSLIYGVFDAIRRNILADEFNLKFFEIGRVYLGGSMGGRGEADRLCIGIAGSANPQDWRRSSEQIELYGLKSLVEGVGRLTRKKLEFVAGGSSVFHPTHQFEVTCNCKTIGRLGRINPRFLDNKKLPEAIYIAELDLGVLAGIPPEIVKMKPVAAFPPITRDLAFVLPLTVTNEKLSEIFRAECGKLLEEYGLFDVYKGKGIEPNHQSLAFFLKFRSHERTLVENDVQPIIDKIVKRVQDECHGHLR